MSVVKTWPEAVRQLDLVIGFPRPLRIDYLLLAWAAVPWLWAHPAWFEWRTWSGRIGSARQATVATLSTWWRSPSRLDTARAATVREARSFFGLA